MVVVNIAGQGHSRLVTAGPGLLCTWSRACALSSGTPRRSGTALLLTAGCDSRWWRCVVVGRPARKRVTQLHILGRRAVGGRVQPRPDVPGVPRQVAAVQPARAVLWV